MVRAAAASFRVDERAAADVAAICHRLDGIPLALELAAVMLRTLDPAQLAARLDDSLHLLRSGHRSAPRHESLEATLDWSYRLLDDAERRVLERLTVFAGSASLVAAEQVCQGGGVTREMVLPVLASLVDKSLVAVEADAERGPRYRLLEVVRQYARSRMSEHDTGESARRHAMFFLALTDETVQRARRSRSVFWLNRLIPDHDNLRLAADYFAEHDATCQLRLVAAAWRYWVFRQYYHEGAELVEQALASAGQADARLLADALCGLVELTWPTGRFERIAELSTESLRLAREAQDVWLESFSLVHLLLAALRDGDTVRGVALGEEGLALARSTGDPWLIGYVLNALATSHHRGGDLARARDAFEESLSICRADQNDRMIPYQLGNLAAIARDQNSFQRAEALWLECLATGRRFRDWRLVARQLLSLAELAFRQRQLVRAARLLGAAEALYERLGVSHEFDLPELDELRSAAGHGELATAREAGGAMPVDQIISSLLSATHAAETVAPRRHGPLTAREREIAALVADGLSNREIARRLVITERTAENHVSHIMDKLGLASRTQVASWVLTAVAER